MKVPESGKRKPSISFIITDYNIPEEMLRECVESVLAVNLTNDEREIILVDDGSEVPPTTTLERYGSHIHYFRQDNKGLSAARNAGIGLATGTYIQFVDGDDRLVKEGYDKVIAHLKAHQNTAATTANTDIVMFRFTTTDNSETSNATARTTFRHTTGRRFLQENNLRAAAWGYLFRRETLGDLRFEDGIYHEDDLFTPLLLCQAGNVTLASATAYYYRQRDTSIINAREKRHIEKRFEDILHVITRLKQLSEEPSYKPLARRVNQLCMDYLYLVAAITGDYGRFCNAANSLKASRLYPLPLHIYTLKYWCFSVMTQTKAGSRLAFKCMSRR